jgi:hypothetical protein
MQNSFSPHRLTRSGPARPLALATLVAGLAIAGCAGSSHERPRNSVGAASADAPPTGGSASATSPATDGSAPLAFARCMRANGVPNFPDPSPGGGLEFKPPPAFNPGAPAVRAAQAKCRKVLPGGGPPAPGTQTHPSGQTLAKLVRTARCMRQHGVPQFPDPQTSIPPNPVGIRQITDFDGAILLFPSSINMQAPAYRRALAACQAPPLGLSH